MATSINIPALNHAIRADIPAINEVIKALAKNDPSALSDLEVGTKRIVEEASVWEIQQYNGSTWTTLSNFNINAQKVDSYSASTGTTANTIPVRDSRGKLAGDITGNAATATEAEALSTTNPVEMGGTGATTAAAARTNLDVPPTSHDSTDTKYGASSASKYGHAKASATTPKALGTASVGTETSTFARGDHVHPTTTATGSVLGMVKLSDSTSSTSAASAGVAASPKAVKAAYDRGTEGINAAQSAANSRISNAAIDGFDLVLTYGDGTTKRVKLPAGKSVGDLWMGFDSKSKPANVQLYAGQVLSRSSYSAHWNYVNGGARTVLSESAWQAQVTANGFCPYYSSGDGSTTYRMPLIKGVHPKFVAALAEAGQYLEAGLPNITGSIGAVDYFRVGTCSGAFSATGTTVNESDGTWTNKSPSGFNFNASRSSSIYGNSSTVQPPSVTCILGEYVVGGVAVIGEADTESLLASVTQLESEVGALNANKLGRTEADKAEIVSWGMPDYSAGLGLSLTNYSCTIPADGWVHFHFYTNGVYETVSINNVLVAYAGGTGRNGDSGLIPVKKNDIIKFTGVGYEYIVTLFPLKGA